VCWAGTSGNGLSATKTANFSLTGKQGLVNDFVTALFEDREGSLWIGTSDGLSQLTDLKFPIYSSTEGLIGGSCHSVSASQRGGLWAAMNGGFSYFDGKEAINYTAAEGLPNPYIKRVLEAKNGDIYLTDGSTVGIFADGKLVARAHTFSHARGHGRRCSGVIVSVVSNLFRVSRNQLSRILSRTATRPRSFGFTTWSPGGMVPSGSPASMEFFGSRMGPASNGRCPKASPGQGALGF